MSYYNLHLVLAGFLVIKGKVCFSLQSYEVEIVKESSNFCPETRKTVAAATASIRVTLRSFMAKEDLKKKTSVTYLLPVIAKERER